MPIVGDFKAECIPEYSPAALVGTNLPEEGLKKMVDLASGLIPQYK